MLNDDKLVLDYILKCLQPQLGKLLEVPLTRDKIKATFVTFIITALGIVAFFLDRVEVRCDILNIWLLGVATVRREHHVIALKGLMVA